MSKSSGRDNGKLRSDVAEHEHMFMCAATVYVYLVLSTSGVAGLPLDGVVPDLRRLLVLGHGVVSPGDSDRV